MGVGNVWSRALVYFGIVEEDEYWDEEAYAAEEDLERTYADRESRTSAGLPRAAAGRPSSRTGRSRTSRRAQTAVLRPAPGTAPARGGRCGFGARPPRCAAELQRRPVDRGQVQGVRARDRQPPGHGRRALEAADRLLERAHIRARTASMQRVADKVFLLTPRNVEVSAEERARLIDHGFYNQS